MHSLHKSRKSGTTLIWMLFWNMKNLKKIHSSGCQITEAIVGALGSFGHSDYIAVRSTGFLDYRRSLVNLQFIQL